MSINGNPNAPKKLFFLEFLTQGPGVCFNIQTQLTLIITEVSMVVFDDHERERERKIV